MTQPESRAWIDDEDDVQVVNLLQEVVWQQDCHFQTSDDQEPDLNHVALLVGLMSSLDVPINADIEG